MRANELLDIKTISIKFTLPYILLTISFTAFAFFILTPSYREEIKFLWIVAAGMCGVFSVYFTYIALKQQMTEKKIERAFEIIRSLYDVTLIRYRVKLDKRIDFNGLSSKEFYNSIMADEEIATALRASLNLFEHLSIAIQVGHSDEEVSHREISTVAIKTYFRFKPYIDHTRSFFDDRTIFCEFEKLANAWNEGRYLSTGHKIQQQ